MKTKCYKVVVREIHYYEKTYYINADSKAEANERAKNYDYEDAEAGEYIGCSKSPQIIERASVHDNEPI